MSDAQTPEQGEPEEVESTLTEGLVLRRGTQAEYDAARKQRKERAAVTVKENAKSAERAKKKALAKGLTVDDGGLASKASAYEKRANQRAAEKAKQ